MWKFTLTFIFILASINANSMEYSFKADASRSFTDNVNLTSSEPVSDAYSTIGAHIQMNDETYKLKLRGIIEKYQKQSENDNYFTDISFQYKRTKTNNYTLSLFKQEYSETPLFNMDSASDNIGTRLSTTIINNFDTDNTGYVLLTGTYKKYSTIEGRNDTVLSASLGLEHSFSDNFKVSPELNVQMIHSTQIYYSNISYGPMLLFTYNPNDHWELFFNGSYAHTAYKERPATSIVKQRTIYEREYQRAVATEFGANYALSSHLGLQAKYSSINNRSNNDPHAYRANVLSVGLSFKF